jgi:hypothetical protein
LIDIGKNLVFNFCKKICKCTLFANFLEKITKRLLKHGTMFFSLLTGLFRG